MVCSLLIFLERKRALGVFDGSFDGDFRFGRVSGERFRFGAKRVVENLVQSRTWRGRVLTTTWVKWVVLIEWEDGS